MHYSDCYPLLKKIADKTVGKQLKEKLDELVVSSNTPSFVEYLKSNREQNKQVTELRDSYDLEKLDIVAQGISNLIEDFDRITLDPAWLKIKYILVEIRTTALNEQSTIKRNQFTTKKFLNNYTKNYPSHYIPFNQSSDPFKGKDYNGFCWGHTHRYGKVVSEYKLNQLSVASDITLYKQWKRNWTISDILFRRIGWYFSVSTKPLLRKAIWDVMSRLDDKSIFNFNFLTHRGFHSTSLRMVGEGIEYYDNNYGIVRFDNREKAVRFLIGHLKNQTYDYLNDLRFITVYKLPYANHCTQDVFTDLPETQINFPVEAKEVVHTPELQQRIDALEQYGQTLNRVSGIKAKIKSTEIKYLVQELKALDNEKVLERVNKILTNKKHSLMLNRGTGLYFFKSHFKSHSQTESHLQAITEASKPV